MPELRSQIEEPEIERPQKHHQVHKQRDLAPVPLAKRLVPADRVRAGKEMFARVVAKRTRQIKTDGENQSRAIAR